MRAETVEFQGISAAAVTGGCESDARISVRGRSTRRRQPGQTPLGSSQTASPTRRTVLAQEHFGDCGRRGNQQETPSGGLIRKQSAAAVRGDGGGGFLLWLAGAAIIANFIIFELVNWTKIHLSRRHREAGWSLIGAPASGK